MTEVIAIGHWRLLLAVTQSVLLGLAAGAGLLLLIPLLRLTGMASEFADLPLAARVGDVLAWMGIPATLPSVLALFLSVVTTQALLAGWQAQLSFALQRAMTTTLRERLYDAVVRSRWAYFSRQRSTDLSHALTTTAHTAGAGVHHVITLASGMAVASVHLALAAYLSPAATGAALAGGSVVGVLLHRGAGRARDISVRYLSASSVLHGTAVEHLQSFKTMKCVGAEARSARLFRDADDRLAATQGQSVANDNRQRLIFEVGSAAVLAVMIVLVLKVSNLPTGALLLLIFAFARLMPRVLTVQQNLVQLAQALPAFVHLREMTSRLRIESEVPAPAARGGACRVRHEITLRSVSFDYGGAPVLRGVSLTVPAGRITALIGPSGAGKTTIADLLMGLLTPATGDILVDGRPLASMHDWRRHVGYVSQENFLFNDTVRANLLWARPDASDSDLQTALERASASEFISQLEHGMDTILGDRGCRLSGGERQRLALARALLGDPTLLLLDEATNALDRRNEDRILDVLERLTPTVTVVIVAHRTSCVRRANLVYLLEAGQVVESGGADVLASQSARFRELHSLAPDDAAARA